MQPEQIVQKMYQNDAFSNWLGIEIMQIKQGYCKLKMQVNKQMLNGFGIAHGGIAYSLADSALAFASNTHGRQAVSIETSINHLQKLTQGDIIIAEAKEESLQNNLAFYSVTITCKQHKVAWFKGTVFRTKNTW